MMEQSIDIHHHLLRDLMDYLKTTLRVGLLVVIVAAFVEIPYGTAIVAVLGLAIGLQRDTSDMVRTFIIAIGLSITAGALGSIPAVGGYITSIMEGAAALAAASSLGVLSKWIWEQAGM